jgi:protein-L-isoaspartate(D-aspartate) O-methyltransferase
MNANGMGTATATQQYDSARQEMVARQIRDRGIHTQAVLDAMAAVPRHEFVPSGLVDEAYDDKPLQIGESQTISQPYMVAAATEAMAMEPSDRVLEVGCGSGYQSAVLSRIAREVTAVEFRPSLAAAARERLTRLGFKNVHVVSGDGSLGWPMASPYNAILVSAAAPAVPQALVDQLAEGGRLVIPVGDTDQQDLMLLTKKEGRVTQQTLFPCRFVPLLGLHGWRLRADGALEK